MTGNDVLRQKTPMPEARISGMVFPLFFASSGKNAVFRAVLPRLPAGRSQAAFLLFYPVCSGRFRHVTTGACSGARFFRAGVQAGCPAFSG